MHAQDADAPDAAFDDFLSEFFKELEEEVQKQEQQKPPPRHREPRAPLSTPTSEPSEPAKDVAEEISSGDIRTDFLGPSTTFPAFKQEALESYLRSLRTRLEEALQAIGALDVFERRQFNGYEKTVTGAIVHLGHILSKYTYQRALYDKGFNQLRKMVVDLDRVLRGVEEEVLRAGAVEVDPEHIIAGTTSLSPTARVLHSIRGAFTFDIPTVGKNLAKVLEFAQKSIDEKRAMRAQLEKEMQEALKLLDARKPLPHYPARQSYPQRQPQRPAPRNGGYGGYGGASPYGDYYPSDFGFNGYDDGYGKRPGAPGSGATVTQEEKDKKEKEQKKPELTEQKDLTWDELKKIVGPTQEALEFAILLVASQGEELKAKLTILDGKLAGIDKGAEKVRKMLGKNLKLPVTEPPRSKKEQDASKCCPFKNEGPIETWRKNRVGRISDGTTQVLKILEDLKKKSPKGRFNGLTKLHQKIRETQLCIKQLLEDLEKPIKRSIDLEDEPVEEKPSIHAPPPPPPVRDWGEPAPPITPEMLEEGRKKLKPAPADSESTDRPDGQ